MGVGRPEWRESNPVRRSRMPHLRIIVTVYLRPHGNAYLLALANDGYPVVSPPSPRNRCLGGEVMGWNVTKLIGVHFCVDWFTVTENE